MVEGVCVFGMKSLNEVMALVNGAQTFAPTTVDIGEVFRQSSNYNVDFREVRGQQAAKRALEVAAAGSHNMLMM